MTGFARTSIRVAIAVALVGAFGFAHVGGAAADSTNQTTSTTLAVSSTPVNAGDQVTLSATVTGLGGNPVGKVSFFAQQNGGANNVIGNAVSLNPVLGSTTSTASLTTSFETGVYSITAAYTTTDPGDYSKSTSSATILTVATIQVFDTTTTVTASPTTIAPNTDEILTAHVTENGGGSVPTGFVTFYDNGLNLGQAAIDTTTSTATFDASSFIVGTTNVIEAVYMGDVLNHSSSGTFTLGSGQAASPAVDTNTVVTVSPSVIEQGQTVTITAAVTQFDANGNPTSLPPPGASMVKFTANGDPLGPGQVTLGADGTATLAGVAGWTPGAYDIEVAYNGNVLANASSGGVTLTVVNAGSRGASTLSYTGDHSSAVGATATLSGTLAGPSGPLANEQVTLTMGTQSCTDMTDASGNASCTINVTQDPGSYPLSLSFAGDATVAGTTASGGTFTVTQAQDELTVSGSVAGTTTTLSGALVAADGTTPIVGRTVKLTLGTASTTCTAVTDATGVATCTVTTPTGVPSATITGSFAGDADYVAASDTATLTFSTATTVSYTGDTSATYGTQATLSATLLDATGHALAGQTLTFTLGTQSCTGTTNASGNASCTITVSQKPASYPLTVSYGGSGVDLASSATSTFKVSKAHTTLTVSLRDNVWTSTATLTGTLLTTGGSPVAGRTVALTLATQSCTAVTNASGVASCTVSDRCPAGSVAGGSFAGDDYYFSASAGSSSSTGAPVATTVVYSGSKTADYDDQTTLSAALTTAAGAPVANALLTLTMGAQSCTATTDSSGKASCTITVSQASGSYAVKATFGGNSGYSSSTTSGTFTVTKEQDTLSVSASGTRLYGTLLEDGKTPIAGRTITLTLGSQSCSAVTNSSGVATCSVSGNGHTCNVSGTFAGDAYYAAASAGVNTPGGNGTTLQRATTISYTGPRSASTGDRVTLSATLTVGGAPVVNQRVTLTLGSQSCTATTDSNGRASCTITVSQSSGTYAVRASFAGTTAYAASNTSSTFTVARNGGGSCNGH